MTADGLRERFSLAAGAVGAKVLVVRDLAAAFRYAADLAKNGRKRELIAAGWSPDQASLLASVTRSDDLKVLTDGLRKRPEGFEVSVTPVSWGVAETGTLVVDSSSEHLRLATMLADIHVAVLAENKLVPNLESIESELDALLRRDPSYLAFITGASRTADIERVLALGVHGPLELHILILEEA